MPRSSQRFKKLMKRERKLILRGQGALAEAQKQLDAESAEQFYEQHRTVIKSRQHPKYLPSTEELIGRWATRTADMLYNRKRKREQHEQTRAVQTVLRKTTKRAKD